MSIISSKQLAACKRLLFISPVALGDFLYLKTFLIALKNSYPHIELDIWLDDCRCNDDSWRLSRSKILQQWISSEPAFVRSYGCTDSVLSQNNQINEASKMDYDLIICHSGSKSHLFSAIARKISSKAFIVSSIAKSPMKGLADRWFFRHSNAIYKLNAQTLPKNHHITDRFYTILHDICGLSLEKNSFMPELIISEQAKQKSQQWLSENLQHNSEKVILINHLSTNIKRDWSEKQVVKLIKKINAHAPSTQFIINVTQEQLDRISDVINSEFSHEHSNIAIFTIQENFFELPAIIAASNLVITVETAIMHFATAAKTPLIALMRSKKPYWAPPITASSKVLYSNKGKGYVSDIDVDTVYNQFLAMTS